MTMGEAIAKLADCLSGLLSLFNEKLDAIGRDVQVVKEAVQQPIDGGGVVPDDEPDPEPDPSPDPPPRTTGFPSIRSITEIARWDIPNRDLRGEQVFGDCKGGMYAWREEESWKLALIGKDNARHDFDLTSDSTAVQLNRTTETTASAAHVAGYEVGGMLRLDKDRWLYSNRANWATSPPAYEGPFLTLADKSTGIWDKEAIGITGVNNRPKFGGGLCEIPQWFQDAIGHPCIVVGKGGYESGQQSSLGPTCVIVNHAYSVGGVYTIQDTVLRFNWNGDKDNVEKRTPDYNATLFPAWHMPDGDVGYWQGDAVAGSPFWVDNDSGSALCYFVIQGVGDIDYDLQRLGFSRTLKTTLYMYAADDLLKVAKGEMGMRDMTPQMHVWNNPFGNAKHPIAAHFDQQTKSLFVAYLRAGLGNYDTSPKVIQYQWD